MVLTLAAEAPNDDDLRLVEVKPGEFVEAPWARALERYDFELDLDNLTLHWVLSYQDLSSAPTAITLHAPAQPGATGAAIVNLAVPGLASPTKGSAKLTDAQAEYLLTGWSYALVTTRKYAKGEAIEHPMGYPIKITTPLDWMGVTDHSEYVGVVQMAADGAL